MSNVIKFERKEYGSANEAIQNALEAGFDEVVVFGKLENGNLANCSSDNISYSQIIGYLEYMKASLFKEMFDE